MLGIGLHWRDDWYRKCWCPCHIDCGWACVQNDDDEDDELPSPQMSAESLHSVSMEFTGARRFSLGFAGRPSDIDEPSPEPPVSRIRSLWRRVVAFFRRSDNWQWNIAYRDCNDRLSWSQRFICLRQAHISQGRLQVYLGYPANKKFRGAQKWTLKLWGNSYAFQVSLQQRQRDVSEAALGWQSYMYRREPIRIWGVNLKGRGCIH